MRRPQQAVAAGPPRRLAKCSTGIHGLAGRQLPLRTPTRDHWSRTRRASSRSRAIEIEVGPLPHAHGDPLMLRRVWANLRDNAIKFTGRKPNAVVEVGAHTEGGETVFFVKDNNVGFGMRYADKLFGVFQHLHSMEGFLGTAIRLASVKRIATRHGGRVWAEGKAGEEATFWYALPQAAADHA